LVADSLIRRVEEPGRMVRPNLTVGTERWAPRGDKLVGTGSRDRNSQIRAHLRFSCRLSTGRIQPCGECDRPLGSAQASRHGCEPRRSPAWRPRAARRRPRLGRTCDRPGATSLAGVRAPGAADCIRLVRGRLVAHRQPALCGLDGDEKIQAQTRTVAQERAPRSSVLALGLAVAEPGPASRRFGARS
jgi:hypothetical protein